MFLANQLFTVLLNVYVSFVSKLLVCQIDVSIRIIYIVQILTLETVLRIVCVNISAFIDLTDDDRAVSASYQVNGSTCGSIGRRRGSSYKTSRGEVSDRMNLVKKD